MINGNGTVDYELIPPNAHKISLEHQVSVTGHQFITDVYQAHERTSHHCATAIKLKICINCLAVPLFIEGLFIRDICIYIFVTTCAAIGPIFSYLSFLILCHHLRNLVTVHWSQHPFLQTPQRLECFDHFILPFQ